MLAIVLGGAAEALQELEQTKALLKSSYLLVVINDMITVCPDKIDAMATLHPEKLDGWLKARFSKGWSVDFPIWSHRRGKHVTHETRDHMIGSSGMFATQIALSKLFCSHVVLCGVPMDARSHLIRGKPWTQHHIFDKVWRREASRLKNHVRSWSGLTRELLGKPTEDWMNGWRD